MNYNKISRVPGSIAECFAEDQTSVRLRKWSVGIWVAGFVCFGIVIIAGLITASQGAKVVKLVSSVFDSPHTVEQINGEVFWSLFTPFLVSAAAVLFLFLLSSLMLSAFASIVYHSKVSAYATVFAAGPKDGPAPAAPRPAGANEGIRRPAVQRKNDPVPGGGIEKPFFDFEDDPEKTVICPNCGSENRSDRKVCWNCEAYLYQNVDIM